MTRVNGQIRVIVGRISGRSSRGAKYLFVQGQWDPLVCRRDGLGGRTDRLTNDLLPKAHE